jgi:regulatory protein
MKIERLEPSKHIKGRYLLYLSDETVQKVTENEVVRFGLTPGRELDPDTLAQAVAAGNLSNAKALAAKFVGARPLSRRELLKKLADKGISPEDAQAATDWLEDIGGLDEAAYAAAIVRHYSQRGCGGRKIQEELYRRGIPKDLWEDAMEEAAPPEEGIDRFIRSKLRGKPLDDREKKRICDGLLRRGYSWSQVREGLNRFGGQVYED